ncbi:glycosyltransferase family 2 protein [Pseudomonadota bacterium]
MGLFTWNYYSWYEIHYIPAKIEKYKLVRVVAILAVRNEIVYIRRCIQHLIEQGIKVAVIDNESTDGTPDICSEFSPEDVIEMQIYPFNGVYEWEKLLIAKDQLRRKLDADWIIHQDADEFLWSNRVGESLQEALARAAQQNYDAVNFDEFVFIPDSQNISYDRTDFVKCMNSFYFFEPVFPNRILAFSNSLLVDNVSSGGHTLPMDQIRLFPQNMVLRHYIFLSRQHAIQKYERRVYRKAELQKGWHSNRVNVDWAKLTMPDKCILQDSSGNLEGELTKSQPMTKHFWDWYV